MVKLREHAADSRLFLLGVGERASHHLLLGLARAGHGVAEVLSGKEPLEKKVDRHLRRALQPRVSDLKLDWGALAAEIKPGHQSPSQPAFLYDAEPLTIYAMLDGSIPAAEEFPVALKASTPAGPVSFPVTVKKATCFQTGSLVHRLVASALIRDAESGLNALPEDQLLSLSTTYMLTSAHSSFIAAEKSEKWTGTLLSFRLLPEIEEPEPEAAEEEEAPPVPSPVRTPSPMPTPATSTTPPLPADPNAPPKRKQYEAHFLLSFQALCTDKPPGMPSFDAILGSSTKKSGEKRGGGGGGEARRRQRAEEEAAGAGSPAARARRAGARWAAAEASPARPRPLAPGPWPRSSPARTAGSARAAAPRATRRRSC